MSNQSLRQLRTTAPRSLHGTARWLTGADRWLLGVMIWLMTWLGGASAAEVRIGIEGHYRVGHWTAVRTDETEFDFLETRDGDGVEVRYRRAAERGDWGYVIPGSEAAPLILRQGEDVVVSTRFPTLGSPSRGPAMIPLTTPWIVAIGDPLGVETIGFNEILGRDAIFAVSRPSEPKHLPDSARGYDGVDLMILGGAGRELLQALEPDQRQAIQSWILTGGRVLLTLGESAPELLQSAPWLADLLPLRDGSPVAIDPSAVETFTSSQFRLRSFTGFQLPSDQGNQLLVGRTTRRTSVPIAVEYNVGFGRVTVVAADLESELFANWPDRLQLITRLTGSLLTVDQQSASRRSRATAFNDLAGQLRLTLDRFSIQRTVGFSIVSLILMALIAAIGPLDYLLITRLLGRPLLGWLSFPIVTLGLSAILMFQSRPAETPTPANELNTGSGNAEQDLPIAREAVRCNRIEVFDLDLAQGIGRGFAANYLYAQQASLFDVEVSASASLQSISQSTSEMLTVPFGYPGESFGGIQIAIEDSRLPVYSVDYEPSSDGRAALRTTLKGMPLASRSSKGLSTSCRFHPNLAIVPLEHRPGSELLQGELVNPLPVDLLDGMLVYRNWAYLLPTRFPAGGRISSVDSLRQKNFRWQLTRQRALQSSSESEVWDPTDTTSLSRIAEMLMFHDVVGGERYTTLNHGPLHFLDLTHVLADDRCVLIGRVEDPLTELQTRAGDDIRSPEGNRLTMIRVVIPVVDAERS